MTLLDSTNGEGRKYRLARLAPIFFASSFLRPLAYRYAERLAALPPLAVRMAKESLNKGLDVASLKEAAQIDIYRFMLLGQTEDSHEAHRAWRERRKPVFKGQ